MLHRNLLLPFMGLPCSERQQTTGTDQPSADIEQTDIETDNLSESVSEEDTVSSSNEESRSPLLGNTVSSGQHSPSGSIAKVDDKYVIPMRRGGGGGWSGGAMVLGKLPVPGRPTIWIAVGQGPITLAVGAGGGGLDIFTLIYPSLLSPSLWETARCRLKYCLKGPLNPKQPTNQPTNNRCAGNQVRLVCYREDDLHLRTLHLMKNQLHQGQCAPDSILPG